MNSETLLKIFLRIFGWVSVLAFFPMVMPWEWMTVVHRWLGMGELRHQPVVEYLARATSALCGLYGGFLLMLAEDVRRYRVIIVYQAITVIITNSIGTVFGLKAGMPAWWMIGDCASCWFFCGGMLWFAHRIRSDQ